MVIVTDSIPRTSPTGGRAQRSHTDAASTASAARPPASLTFGGRS